MTLLPGTSPPVNVTLRPQADNDADIIVVARRVEGFSSEEIRKTPQVDRRIQDIVRRDSRAFVDRGGPEDEQGISILGFNTRFNNLVIDGLSQQDSFGQDFTGLPTRRNPISLDAIESIEVQTAPFDVQNSNFQGGQINITTKSGGNALSGSLFYQRSGGFLTGSRAGTDSDGEAIQFDGERPENTWGATIGGPILKDRLFFFLSYEQFNENDVLGACPAGVPCENPSETFSLETYEQIRQIAQARYGIETGDYNDFLSIVDGERRLLGKFDWNITDRHRASVTVQRTDSDDIGTGAAPGLDSPSSFATTDRNSTGLSAQLFSNWTDRFSTQVLFGWRDQNRTIQPLFDQDIGLVVIENIVDIVTPDDDPEDPPTTTLSIGADDLVQFNTLDTRRFQYRFRGEYVAGRHTLSFGYERDSQNILRFVTPNARGTFTFGGDDPIANFANGTPDSVTAIAPISGDSASLIADYTTVRNGWFIQDAWSPTADIDVLLGLRYERFSQDEAPEANPFFLQRYGFSNTETLDGTDVFQPRFQVNWRPTSRTSFYGGIGVFAGGVPQAFFNETFITDGVSSVNAEVDGEDLAGPVDPATLPPEVAAVIAEAQTQQSQEFEGDVYALDRGFEVPRNLRFQVGVDQRFDVPFLGKDWRIGFEYTYSEILQAIQFVDLRPVQQVIDGQPVFLPDGTPRFVTPPISAADARPGASGAALRNSVTNAVLEQDILITNTQDGSTRSINFELEKQWDAGRFGRFGFRGDYSLIRSIDVSPANDTDNLADVFETGAYSNVNDPAPGFSIQSIPHNFIYEFDWTMSSTGRRPSGRTGRPACS